MISCSFKDVRNSYKIFWQTDPPNSSKWFYKVGAEGLQLGMKITKVPRAPSHLKEVEAGV